MAGTALLRVEAHPAIFSAWVLLPDGTIREPYNLEDWQFWWSWGKLLLGWYQVNETILPDCRVSTIFLGLDHDNMLGWDWSEPMHPVRPDDYMPLVFESMIFGGDHSGRQSRCRTLHSARAMHRYMVKVARGKRSYKCPHCGEISFSMDDRRQRYCGSCHQFGDDHS